MGLEVVDDHFDFFAVFAFCGSKGGIGRGGVVLRQAFDFHLFVSKGKTLGTGATGLLKKFTQILEGDRNILK